ncbi:MAG: bifunctional 4-hydroxy-2-oxoglutarate aldolase/2-dehydro-3-deoxy-phosphogluconate aldolase [Lachnospiraceae bacterium]|jgi:2-dehydro-3-deoxyphosphogluconate aldolase/(4S)-4-hydroxy-2-oxoglutarate aldolase|nr:bifunctional 4-hydroxy-2-oxoglutarate aldolase/2-dehydro-3-deoxy-phosphogluconate aldolase [Lachnospiraceae bacterium]MBR3736650.1 bifunctional 4-hydroxy-2-oxoglutarate aldolase/2-dehydro-3-deoxy-phosphogluconate aldolase [Lachnospiraceae bacterium]MBR6157326.1 bifunctional 4-hydroxy-2-oxoglutarate aldolase/2-dehydro-3-deoxy-phosphogluconate aldolase [Lachnospiraceae bacterium]MBR6851917.1 bifunctional 4-hydroxy-2-oxoglutarate aldolase/2-dehydro-3-deoxy-phosphogluconate aldolase [Lachnospirac
MSAKSDAVFQKFEEVGIIPVVVLNDAKDAEPLGKALMQGGLPAAEVTFRTAAAEESIRIMAEKFPDMLVGAGTVLTTDQVDRAVAAGAKFIVAPGLDEEVVKYCLEKDIPVCPGTQTASEMMKAIKLGLTHVKFFPAENAGGLAMIKAIGAALTALRFMPTGGINATNVVEYLKNDKIFCCGGSWMVKGDMIKAGQFDEIEKKVAEAAAIVKANRG